MSGVLRPADVFAERIALLEMRRRRAVRLLGMLATRCRECPFELRRDEADWRDLPAAVAGVTP
jgi:hypothetical protein